jgi:hypothetical protein
MLALSCQERRGTPVTEHDPEQIPTDDDLDLEAPNEGATGDNPELDDADLEDLEDDDGYADEDDDDY